ncbi:uncharacterized protein BDZ99DRAFT_532676 [Mytilinidion resinicola]|uniref:Uncharacterized protein n=1 Tax=Mytilinidion resinicola TaxID=574789 RepID=A0A6A6YJG1_9PEZI|nr:uncharacterized protein BDZ99DRAFT_532676 [Mytilinidion resinicola]KAF2808709.1 hypothetical protein BDZ99DRAFT_532676 [Mytilinidion resinicola]
MGNTLSNRPDIQVAGHYRPVLTNCPCSPSSNLRLRSRSRSRSPSSHDYPSPRYHAALPLRGVGGPAPYRPSPGGGAFRSPRPPTPAAYGPRPRAAAAYPMASPHWSPAAAYPAQPYPQPQPQPQPYPQPPARQQQQPPYQPPYQPGPYQAQPQYQPQPRPPVAAHQPPPVQRDYARFPGDAFLDACFCKTACRCRQGTRVLYRSRRADGTMGEGEIRYELKEDVENGMAACGGDDGRGGKGRGDRGKGDRGCRERVKKSERKVLGRMEALERGRRRDVDELRRLVGMQGRRGEGFGGGGGGGGGGGMDPRMGRGMREMPFGMGGGGRNGFVGDPYGEMGAGGGGGPGDMYAGMGYEQDFGEESIPDHEFGANQAGRFAMGGGMPPRGARPPRGAGRRQSAMGAGPGMHDDGLDGGDPRGQFGNRGRGGQRGGRPQWGRRGLSGRGMRPGQPLDDSEGLAGNPGGEGEEWVSEDDSRRENADGRDGPAEPQQQQQQQQQQRPPPQARRSSRMGSGQGEAWREARGAMMDSVQDEEFGGGPGRTV